MISHSTSTLPFSSFHLALRSGVSGLSNETAKCHPHAGTIHVHATKIRETTKSTKKYFFATMPPQHQDPTPLPRTPASCAGKQDSRSALVMETKAPDSCLCWPFLSFMNKSSTQLDWFEIE